MTLTPEMVDTYRLQFERVVRAWPNYTERTLARDGRATEYYGNPVVQGAWEGFKAARAQSQRAVTDLDLLQALRAEIQTQSGLKDCYQEWEDTENLLSALIERAGGGV